MSPALPELAALDALRAVAVAGEYLSFTVGACRLAVGVESVQEIRRPGAIARLPDTPDWVEGVMNVHGQAVPVVDLAQRLGLCSDPPAATGSVIVFVRHREGLAGLRVDTVQEVLRVSTEQVSPPPTLDGWAELSWLRGVHHDGDALTLLLDLDRLS